MIPQDDPSKRTDGAALRILHISDHTLRFNGMAHAAVDLACSQAGLGHQVALCSGQGGFDDILSAHGVTRFAMPAPAKSVTLIRSVTGIFKAIREFKPDVVHTHMVASTLIAWPMAKVMGVSFVTCVQNSFSKAAVVMKLGDRVITGCKAVAETMTARGIPSRKLRPILNGTIGSARYPLPGPGAAPLQRPAVITVCGLHPRKGIPDLIEGFAQARRALGDIHLYIVGEGPYEAQYKASVDERDAGHVHFIAATPDPRPYMRGADLFVLASLADPAPLILSEAREAGLAVIGTRVDGIPELLEYGDAGLLVAPGAPDEIARGIVAVLSEPDALAQWRSRSQVNIERLRISRVASATVEVYRELTGRPRQPVMP